MRVLVATALAIFLINVAGTHVSAQTGVPAPLQLPSAGPAPGVGSGPIRIEWEVRNRFRLFRNEADFRRHEAAHRGDGILAAEQRLARASDGRGWARDMVDNLCVDQTGRLPESCLRDGEKENYLSPVDHPIIARAVGAVPQGALCAWTFDDGEGTPGQATTPLRRGSAHPRAPGPHHHRRGRCRRCRTAPRSARSPRSRCATI